MDFEDLLSSVRYSALLRKEIAEQHAFFEALGSHDFVNGDARDGHEDEDEEQQS